MAREFLDAPLPGVAEYLHFDGDESAFHLERVQDVEPILRMNAAERLDNPSGYGRTREWKLAARVPVVVWLEWVNRFGVDPMRPENEALLARLLNDPEWRALRCSEGAV